MSNSIINAAMARFFNVSHIWAYAQDEHKAAYLPASYPNVVTRIYDVVESWSFAFKGFPLYAGKTVTGPEVDCSNLVQQSLLKAGFNVSYYATKQLFTFANPNATTGDYLNVATANAKPGDLVLFNGPLGGHVGIITDFDPGTGTYGGEHFV